MAHPDAVELPPPGTQLKANGTAFRVRKRGADVRVLSPVDGEVVETGGPGQRLVSAGPPGQARVSATCCAARRCAPG